MENRQPPRLSLHCSDKLVGHLGGKEATKPTEQHKHPAFLISDNWSVDWSHSATIVRCLENFLCSEKTSSLLQSKKFTTIFYVRALISPHVRESMTVLDPGFHPVDSGFRVLDSVFQLSGFRIPKRAGVHIFFSVLMLFFAFRSRVRILLYWKTLLEGITTPSLFSFSIYKIRGRNVLEFLKGLWYNNEGDIGGLSTAQRRRKK